MTPEKQKQRLSGHSNIAQKVFEFVPIVERWTPSQISDAMRRTTGSRIDHHILKGCLITLKDAGLVRSNSGDEFQRVPVTEKEAKSMTVKKTQASNPAPQPATTSAIDLLAGIAKAMRDLATEIETAAIVIEDGSTKDADELGKLRQLQALLKGLA